MHELTLAENLRQIILEKYAERHLNRIKIEVGELSGVTPDSFNFCVNAILKSEFGEHLILDISYKKATARCECKKTYEIDNLLSPCPYCDNFKREIIEGNDIILKSIEME